MNVVANGLDGKRDRLFNFRPALFAAVFLILGIVFAYYRILYGASLWWLLFGVPVVSLTLLFATSFEGLYRRVLCLLLLTLCFAVGFTAFRSQLYRYQDCVRFGGQAVVTGTVESRKETDGSVKLLLRDITVGSERVKGKLITYLPVEEAGKIKVADKILLQGEIVTDTDYYKGYGFSQYSLWHKQYYRLYSEECVQVGVTSNLFLRIRARMERVIYEGMGETPAALTLALLTGDMSGADEGLVNNMRYGGISHIFAVSGLNVGALFAFCLLVFAKTPLRRAPKWVRFFLLVAILWLYAGICSFTASVVRAAVTCVVGYFVKLLGIGYDLLDALGVAAMFILLLVPSQLFDVGFQLSFLACLGLVLLTKPITQVFDECKNFYRKYFPRRYSAEQLAVLAGGDTLPLTVGQRVYRFTVSLLSASLAAQLMTAPALLIHFDFLSGWSLLLNFIFVPIIDGAFTVLLILVVFACLLPASLSAVLLYLPSVCWSGLMLIFEVADFSSFALSGVPLTLLGCVCYYGGLTFLSDKWNISRRMANWLSVVFLAGFAFTILFY